MVPFGVENLDRIDHVVRKGTDPMVDSDSGFFDNGGQSPTGLDDYLKGQRDPAIRSRRLGH